MWDVHTKQAVCEFEEHDKRAWTVDYCQVDPHLLCSGSDDGRVKIWSTNSEASVLELNLRANVCCAQVGIVFPKSGGTLFAHTRLRLTLFFTITSTVRTTRTLWRLGARITACTFSICGTQTNRSPCSRGRFAGQREYGQHALRVGRPGRGDL